MPAMYTPIRFMLVFAAVLLWQSEASAQLFVPNKAGVSMGHLHYHVRDVEANKKFWSALGGQPIKIGGIDVMKFPDVLVFLSSGSPAGGADGSILNHVAFRDDSGRGTRRALRRCGAKPDLHPGRWFQRSRSGTP
jgi:catechol 2,3-dioxygenase-like lactoylglutathione lyase family enzyme